MGQTIAGTTQLESVVTETKNVRRAKIGVISVKKCVRAPPLSRWGVTVAQLVKASVGQADVHRFEPHLGRNWLSCGVFLVKSRHFGLPLAQTTRPNWQSLSAGGSVAIQTWSIYKVYT